MSESFDKALAIARTVKTDVKARITETCRFVVDSASFHFSIVRKLCVVPWSIRRIVRFWITGTFGHSPRLPNVLETVVV